MTSWWDEMERRIRARRVRVDERLALLALLRQADPAARLAAESDRLRQAVEDAIRAVREEALRGEALEVERPREGRRPEADRPEAAAAGPRGPA